MRRRTQLQSPALRTGWNATEARTKGWEMTGGNKQSKEVSKITFRLFPPYTEKVAMQATSAKVNPNQFARIATMAVADGGLLDLSQRMQRIEDELIRLRRDFNQAVDTDKD